MFSWVRKLVCILALALAPVHSFAGPDTDAKKGEPAKQSEYQQLRPDADKCSAARRLSPRYIKRAERAKARHDYLMNEFGPGKRPVSTSEANINIDLHSRIDPFIKAKGQAGSFIGAGGFDIKYWKFVHPKEKGAIVISHGFSENSEYYKEVIYNLYERGYSVYFLDHRGHGQSGRMTDNSMRVHIDKFDNYVEDLNTFVDTVVKADPHEKIVLLGHSMGGLISARYMIKYGKEDNVDKLILTAPLMAPVLRGIPEMFTGMVTDAIRRLGFGSKYAFGQNEEPVLRQGFKGNLLTTSRPRFTMKWKTFIGEDPVQRNNGATFNWVAEALEACGSARLQGSDIDVPTLIFKAGQDRVVRNDMIDVFARGLKDGSVINFSAAKHDLMNERDEIRDELFARIFAFIEAPIPAEVVDP